MSSDNRGLKRGFIQSFFCSPFKNKKVDISTSIIDQPSKSNQLDETSSYTSNKNSESLP